MSALFKYSVGAISFSQIQSVIESTVDDKYFVVCKGMSVSRDEAIELSLEDGERLIKEWEEYLEPKTTQSVEWLMRRVNQLAKMVDTHFRKEDPPSAATLDTLRMIIDETGG